MVDGRLIVAGKPFFPLMLIDQCTPADAARARTLGINLIVNESCPAVSAAAQLGAISPFSLAVLPIGGRQAHGGGLAGWAFPDEPENNGWTPDRLRDAFRFPRGTADGLLSFVTTGGGFFNSAYTPSSVPAQVFGRYARLSDVAGFDLYPLGHCTTDLSGVYDAQRAFNALAGKMPTFQWIETGPIKTGYCGAFQMSPAELRAEVWLAIAGGARGIGYFTHTWTPDHSAFDVRPELQRQIAKTNNLIAAVRPALTGATIASTVDTTSVKVLARRSGKTIYVIAVNASRAPIRMQLHVPGLQHGNIRVFGENRAVSVNTGTLDDGFQPLGVHVYVQRRE